MSVELKQCPFCGNKDSLVIVSAEDLSMSADPDQGCVCCDVNTGGCGGCSGFYDDKEEIISAWNNRAG